MDPSEFEGTVERQGEVLHAGKFEELLLGMPTTFTWLDLNKESGDIYLNIYNLQQAIEKSSQETITPEEFTSQLDEESIKLAELKEDYLKRRKTLTAKVKAFLTMVTPSTNHHETGQSDDDEEVIAYVSHAHEVVDVFKKEYDHVVAMAKYSENCFLQTCRHLRNQPDYPLLVQSSLQACLRLQEIIKKAQEQLNIANDLLNRESEDGEQDGNRQQLLLKQELESLRVQYEQEKEHLKQQSLSDLMDMKSKYELEWRSRERQLTSRHEEVQLEAQQRMETMLANKETYIGSLIQSLQECQQKVAVFEERGRTLEGEETRRRLAEDRLREALVTNADLAAERDRFSTEVEILNQQLTVLKQNMESEREQMQEKINEMNNNTRTLQTHVQELDKELALRPSVDLDCLASKIGYACGQDEGYSWFALETFICETIRKQGTENISLKLRDTEQTKLIAQLQKSQEDLRRDLAAKEQEVRELEREISVAQRANQSARMATTPRPLRSSRPDASNGGEAWMTDLNLDEMEAPLEMKSSEAALQGEDSSSQMLQVLRQQRDRYMRAVQSMQNELTVLRSKCEHFEEEQTQLRNDNLELYRRLRTLRLKLGSSSTKSGDGEVRGRKSASSTNHAIEDEESEDQLDHRYRNLYEKELSPFHVAELDKQQLISKMGLVDKVLVVMQQYVMHDSWTRRAFVCYLVLVHIFALVYCFGVLNPELAGEVDAHLKARWSAETLALPEHPDIA
eukprot:gene9729-10763_t